MFKKLKYPINLFSILIYLYILEKIIKNINNINPLKPFPTNTALLFMGLFSILFGIFLGIKHLLKEIKREGKWKFDIYKFIFYGIPSFIASTFYFAYNSNLFHNVFPNFFVGSYQFLLNSPIIQSFFQIILGYIFITSFIKDNG